MEIQTKSGAAVVINSAPFEDALALNNLVAPYLTVIQTFADGNANIRMDDLSKIMVEAATNVQIQRQVMQCLKRCTYKGQAISAATFEDSQARADYYEVVAGCIKENVTPFVESLFSQFSALLEAYQTKRADTQA